MPPVPKFPFGSMCIARLLTLSGRHKSGRLHPAQLCTRRAEMAAWGQAKPPGLRLCGPYVALSGNVPALLLKVRNVSLVKAIEQRVAHLAGRTY